MAQKPKSDKDTVCMNMVYHYADPQWISITLFDLHLKLKIRTQKKKEIYPNKVPQSLLNSLSIDQRPEAVNQHAEPGHREIDTIAGYREKSKYCFHLLERCPGREPG